MTGIGRVKYDPTINLGHIMQLGVIVLSIIWAYFGIVRDVDRHEQRIETIEKQTEGANAFQRQVIDTLSIIREDIATLKERSKGLGK